MWKFLKIYVIILLMNVDFYTAVPYLVERKALYNE